MFVSTAPGKSEARSVTPLPSLGLPKGGGAIRSVGDKFSTASATGLGSMTIPIAASPGREGFGPQLALNYNSGNGNGVFGLGWSLSLPAISRKTSLGLPTYRDREESDDFILSDAEDLVPALASPYALETDVATAPGYAIRRYRPRIDGAFARMERWTKLSNGEIHWRQLSGTNVLSIYGASPESRIADSVDPDRVFRWLLSETRDDRGNVILYHYKPEDGEGIDPSSSSEQGRGPVNSPARRANRHLKRILYGNRRPLLDANGARPAFLSDLPAATSSAAGWMFELVLDYGEHDTLAPTPAEQSVWTLRSDPFSDHRSGFEIRTARLCRRVLIFHHIPDSDGADLGYDGMVRSTDLAFVNDGLPTDPAGPHYSMLGGVTQTGWRKRADGTYDRASMPPVEFGYSQPVIEDRLLELDDPSRENLPIGLDGRQYRWIDLHGEGIPGVFSESGGGWYYKRNLSPLRDGSAGLGLAEAVRRKPSLSLAGAGLEFLDLAGDGQPDLVTYADGGGLFEHDDAEGWTNFRPFRATVPRAAGNPWARHVDLTGDGTPDLLITEDDRLVWYRSLGESGFAEGQRLRLPGDERDGPRVLFAETIESIQLADVSGDGLGDLVRIRNGEVCYWPNLGYGRFGRKITMDRSPRFDRPDQFDARRIILADVDGSGTTDLVYLGARAVSIYFNLSGNGWSEPRRLAAAPGTDDRSWVTVVDLLGNGTSCLVWSSPLPAAERQPLRYIQLTGTQKPHLLIRVANNMGGETHVSYAQSTKFYLQDKLAGEPWLTRLAFPVHVVERIEVRDRVARTRFVTRFAYHHGYFDGVEREFRGFALVEQWDSEAQASRAGEEPFVNEAAAWLLPPTYTKTWYHTGAWSDGERLSRAFRGEAGSSPRDRYYREPGLSDAQAALMLLGASALPAGLTTDDEREAVRALKGLVARQEIYCRDGGPRETHPYVVTENSARVALAQARGVNRHCVFTTAPDESLTRNYERDPADPRTSHVLTLEVDPFGHVLKDVAISYGRRQPDPALPLAEDRRRQTDTVVRYEEHGYTAPLDTATGRRNPAKCEQRSYELTGYQPSGAADRFAAADFVQPGPAGLTLRFDGERGYSAAPGAGRRRRLIAHVRTLYRRDDLTGLLPLGGIEPLSLTGETYSLAFTAGLFDETFRRNGAALAASPTALLSEGGYVRSGDLKLDGRFPASDGDDEWWAPSGRVFLSPNATDTAAAERGYARRHFFLALRSRSPFHSNAAPSESLALYDAHDLLTVETRDAAGNRVTVGSRRADGSREPGEVGNDYRLLQNACLSDANRNRSQVLADTLGLVAGTVVRGKVEEALGDSAAGFVADLSPAQIAGHDADPLAAPGTLLRRATTRLVYDLFAYHRTRAQPHPDPVAVYSIVRDVHDADLLPGTPLPLQHSVDYADGFGRVIQRKSLVEPGPVAPAGPRVVGRWVADGWRIHDNKGNAVQEFEPFFSASHRFEFATLAGVSTLNLHDPLGRVIAKIRPNGCFEKVLFDSWRQVSYDANDTVLLDPRTDPDTMAAAADYFADPANAGWQTWFARRNGGALGAVEQATAAKAAEHAGTPTVVHLDMLGRPFLTIVDNGPDPAAPGIHLRHASRSEMDVEGNILTVRDAFVHGGDARGRIVASYRYGPSGARLSSRSMDAGARWLFADIAGNPIRAWDDRGQEFRTIYDRLRRPVRSIGIGLDIVGTGGPVTTDVMIYGERHPEAEARNLRGALCLHLDQAGSVAIEARDFKGNTLRAVRRLTSGTRYRTIVDWAAVAADAVALPSDPAAPFDAATLAVALAPFLESDGYASTHTYDAVNRITLMTTPNRPDMQPSTVRSRFNQASLLEAVDVNLNGAVVAGLPDWMPFVLNIDYDAKGQRERIDYANGVTTSYEHDPETFRLTRMVSRRSAILFPADCPQPPSPGWPGCGLQDLRYSYDPVGNPCHIGDAAQQAVFFANRRVEPDASYRYDASYRLVEATGREHLSQAGQPIAHDHDDAQRIRLAQPGDGAAMGSYLERYVYDAVGNLLSMRHAGSNPANPGWTKSYGYAESSRIEDGAGGLALKPGNRLSTTQVGGAAAVAYGHDAHGNMLDLPHLGAAAPNMHWNERDQLRQVDLGGGGSAYFVYDAGGTRIRKVWEKSAALVEERIYLGGFEIFRRWLGARRLERETLHVTDEARRIALVETRTVDTDGTDPAPRRAIRFHLANHLGSSCMELDEAARIVAFEEFTPYGSSAFQSVRSQSEVPRRHRFVGKERDEESGLYAMGVRHYAPWLGRWISADPAGLADGGNLYAYARGSPVAGADPTGTQTQPPGIGEALDEAITLLEGDTKWAAVGKGLRQIQVSMDIDEPAAVGVKGLSDAAARARALDVNNRTFLDSATNRLTKHLGTDTNAMGATGKTVSVADDANALMNRRFGDIDEMRAIFDEAVGKIRNPGSMKATKLKDAINGHMWDIIKNGKSSDAVKVREALGKLGFQNVKGQGYVMQVVDEAGQATKVASTTTKTAAAIAKVETAIAEAAPVIAEAAPAASRLASATNTVAKVAAPVLKVAAPVAKVVAPVAGVVGKVAGPLGVGISGYQLATAQTTDQKIDAGIGLVGNSLMMAPHPLAKAAGGGLVAGQMIDKATNASTHAADAGIYVYEGLKDTWIGDDAAFVIGGAATIVSVPSAIGYGIMDRIFN